MVTSVTPTMFVGPYFKTIFSFCVFRFLPARFLANYT